MSSGTQWTNRSRRLKDSGRSSKRSERGEKFGLAGVAAGGIPLGGFVRGWFGHIGAWITGDVQFTLNFAVLLKWVDQADPTIILLKTASPRGVVPWSGSPGAPDAAQLGVRHQTNGLWAVHNTAMAVMSMATWTIPLRLRFAAGVNTTRFIGIRDATWNGYHWTYNETTNKLSIVVPGTVAGTITFDLVLTADEPYTVISRYDGTTHFADLYDEEGVFIERKSALHSGTTITNETFNVYDNQGRVYIKQMIFYPEFAPDTQLPDIVANSLLEAVPS